MVDWEDFHCMTNPHRVRLRRSLHQTQRHLASLQGLHFVADRADLDVGCVHVFDDSAGIALSFATARKRPPRPSATSIVRLNRQCSMLPLGSYSALNIMFKLIDSEILFGNYKFEQIAD